MENCPYHPQRCARRMCKKNIHEESNVGNSKFRNFSCYECEANFLQLAIFSINHLKPTGYEMHQQV
jgi:hypothetical protein